MRWLGAFVFLLLSGAVAQDASSSICTSDTNTFTVKVNLYESGVPGFEAGPTGYFYFEECGNITNPIIGLELGETYTFNQGDISNYYHPIGFAYFPDGAHVDKKELEPAVTEGTSDCAATVTCPAPMYFRGGTYLGSYSNIAEVANVTEDEYDFGLDKYEPVFVYPLTEWAGHNPFSVKLHFDDETYGLDLFYFCHIHYGMSGRIKLLKNGQPINEESNPPFGEDYYFNPPSEFDQKCGSYGLGDYELPQPQCPETFVCDADKRSEAVQHYAECLNAMSCAMFSGMTTSLAGDDPVDLFIHQMVPHHEGAVNMAKALLKMDVLPCDDFTADTPECMMNGMMRAVINSQNEQIMQMNGILQRKSVALKPEGCGIEMQSNTVQNIGM